MSEREAKIIWKCHVCGTSIALDREAPKTPVRHRTPSNTWCTQLNPPQEERDRIFKEKEKMIDEFDCPFCLNHIKVAITELKPNTAVCCPNCKARLFLGQKEKED